jgi:hypothetical protein
LSNGFEVFFSPGVKRPGHEADHSFLPSTEVKKRGSVHPLPIRLYVVVLNELSAGNDLPFRKTVGRKSDE